MLMGKILGQDVKNDSDKVLYPLKDNTFGVIVMQSIIEHLSNPVEIIKEICKFIGVETPEIEKEAY